MTRVSGEPYKVYVLWSTSASRFYIGVSEDPAHTFRPRAIADTARHAAEDALKNGVPVVQIAVSKGGRVVYFRRWQGHTFVVRSRRSTPGSATGCS